MEDPSQLGASKVPAKFNAGDKVLVPHTDKFYEAKILKVEFRCVASCTCLLGPLGLGGGATDRRTGARAASWWLRGPPWGPRDAQISRRALHGAACG